MSGSLNKVMLIGHLGDDLKMHYFEGGGAIGRFPLATNETYTKKATGEKVTNTDWHNFSCEKQSGRSLRKIFEQRRPYLR